MQLTMSKVLVCNVKLTIGMQTVPRLVSLLVVADASLDARFKLGLFLSQQVDHGRLETRRSVRLSIRTRMVLYVRIRMQFLLATTLTAGAPFPSFQRALYQRSKIRQARSNDGQRDLDSN